MSSRAALGAIIVMVFQLAPVTIAAQDWEAFAAGSSSAQDPVLLSAMDAGDMQTELGICRGVSRRADPSMTGFIQALTNTRAVRGIWQSELLLRVLLEPLSEHGVSGDFRQARLEANTGALDELFSRMDDWKDSQLAATLVRIAPFAQSPVSVQAVVRIGTRVIADLATGKGLIPSQEVALALDYLASATAMGRQEMAEQCMQIARLSYEPLLVKTARAAATTLLSLPDR